MCTRQEVDGGWEIARSRICLDSCSVLGEGEFGRVVKATLLNANSGAVDTVAVKMLKGDARARTHTHTHTCSNALHVIRWPGSTMCRMCAAESERH